MNNNSTFELPSDNHKAARFPLRWRWTMLVGLAVAAAVLVLALVILDMERDAWLESQENQAEVLVGRLADELKIPMLSASTAEVDAIVRSFLSNVPAVLAVHVQYVDGKVQQFGKANLDATLLKQVTQAKHVRRLKGDDLWFAKGVVYGGTSIGAIAVRYSENAWESLAERLVIRMVLAATFVIVLAGILVYWIAGHMSKPMEMLAAAAARVAEGDYSTRLLVQGNDEISDAALQFNYMVEELEQKEEMRNVFGRYLNPKLVAEVFERGEVKVENTRQEVTVLFADMVGFTSFSENTDPEDIVNVLNQHFEVFHSIIDYFGGHVDKYIGDAVMAVFNHPNEDEAHVSHAVMAALAMTAACNKLGVLRPNGEAIAFRVGLNCGSVIVGSIGAAERLEYTVIGDAVNVASRMGGLGEGGEVVLPRATYNQVCDGFVFDSMGEKSVKGVKDTIECGRIHAESDDVVRKVSHAIALAFDLTLPSDVRTMVGDMNT